MISYSGLTNYGKSSFPSVEYWGKDHNIIRDPPKSISTRRIDKVGQTSSITETIDDSGTRACEYINVYARGVNPMVSVSYDNYGNNAGAAPFNVRGAQPHAKLPYTIAKDGAFRPPLLTQYDLLPRSRMPRIWTTSYTNPGFSQWSDQLLSCQRNEKDLQKGIVPKTLDVQVQPRIGYVVETPLLANTRATTKEKSAAQSFADAISRGTARPVATDAYTASGGMDDVSRAGALAGQSAVYTTPRWHLRGGSATAAVSLPSGARHASVDVGASMGASVRTLVNNISAGTALSRSGFDANHPQSRQCRITANNVPKIVPQATSIPSTTFGSTNKAAAQPAANCYRASTTPIFATSAISAATCAAPRASPHESITLERRTPLASIAEHGFAHVQKNNKVHIDTNFRLNPKIKPVISNNPSVYEPMMGMRGS